MKLLAMKSMKMSYETVARNLTSTKFLKSMTELPANRKTLFVFALLNVFLINFTEGLLRNDLSPSQNPSKDADFNMRKKFTHLHAVRFLKQYGYLPNVKDGFVFMIFPTMSDYANALRQFQHFNGIPETGKLDVYTQAIMRQPRCGVPDIDIDDVHSKLKPYYKKKDLKHSPMRSHRRKRWATQGSHLRGHSRSSSPYPVVTYRIRTYGNIEELRGKDDKRWQEETIADAFKIWEKHIPLSFVQIKEYADIDLSFNQGNHGDNQPFDGSGGTLAHAFYPSQGGDIHFDDSEPWGPSGRNLLWVAAHEIGHSLGLKHSTNSRAIMRSEYGGRESKPGNIKLGRDDIIGIQNIYGRRKISTRRRMSKYTRLMEKTTPTPRTTKRQNNRYTQNPRRSKYLRPTTRTPYYNLWTTRRPRTTRRKYPYKPIPSKRRTYKPRPYWRRTAKPKTTRPTTPQPTPRTTADWRLAYFRRRSTARTTTQAPEVDICSDYSIDSMTALQDGSVYAFKGYNYWKVDIRHKRVAEGYPRRISDDFNIRDKIDATILDEDFNLVAFTKNKKIYRFDAEDLEEWVEEEVGNRERLRGDNLRNYWEMIVFKERFNKKVDAAVMVTNSNSDWKAYFFQGTRYWIDTDFDGSPDEGYGRNLWEISPDLWYVDAAVYVPSQRCVYLFSGTKFYKVREMRTQLKVVSGYPKDIGKYWFGCKQRRKYG